MNTSAFKIATFPHCTFEFDGHEFTSMLPGYMDGTMAPYFYIAYRAKRGDEAAIAVATATKLYIADKDGVAYVDYRRP